MLPRPFRGLLTVWLAVVPVLRAQASSFTANGTQPAALTHPVQASSACTTCHGNYDPANHIEAGPTWQGSLMGQAGRDPLFWASLDVANHDAPGIGDFCLRCHAGSAWLAGRSEPPGGSVDGCSLVGLLDQQNNDFDGVNCDLCHRMHENPSPPPGQQPRYLDNGQFWLDDGSCGGQPCRYGPYDYNSGGLTAAPHVWAFSSYVQSADMCGNCHNVTSPAHNLLVNGVDAGIPFPIERTHREWQQSIYGIPGGIPTAEFTTCQDCHMPRTTVNPAYASSFQLNNHTGNMGVHTFAGGNAWIAEVLRDEYPALGIGPSLTASADAARAMLASAAAVAVEVPSVVRPGQVMAAEVAVTNLSGHKLPTGYPEGRRMWLHIEARDGNGALIFESGAYDAASGQLTLDPQVKVYESKQGIWNPGTSTCETESAGKPHFHFVKNNCVALDNRIPPKGFTGGSSLETNPVGYSYPEVAPGVLSHVDVTSYSIPVPMGVAAPVTVTATLRYQTTSKEYVEFLLDEATTHGFPNDCNARTTGLPGKSRAAVLYDMWEDHGRSAPVTMTSGSGVAAVRLVDAFLCAKSKVTKRTAPAVPVLGMSLPNASDSGSADVKKLAHLCAPADPGVGILDPATHLTARQVKGTVGSPQAGLMVSDALGSLSLDSGKAALLLVPTALGTVPPSPTAHAVDNFTCYKAKVSAGTPKLPKGLRIDVTSGFGPDRTLDVKALRLLCIPADRGNGRKNPAAGLACYKAGPTKGEPAMATLAAQPAASDLGSLTIDAKSDAMLCLPASYSS
jgi:hypothetical protein